MRNPALDRAEFGAATSLLGLFENWKARRETARLLQNGDGTLRMSGTTAEDIR